MLSASTRLLKLLSLLQSQRVWAGADLAAHLSVNVRTLRRDVDRLRQLGYPVEACPGVAGGYRLGQGAFLPPLMLEDDEAIALLLALRTAHAGVLGIQNAAVRCLGKLQKLLPSKFKQQAEALSQAVTAQPWGQIWVESGHLVSLAEAIQEHRVATFLHTKRTGRASLRRVEPVGVVYTAGRWYLAAWDLDRNDWRTFRIDRISGPINFVGTFEARALPEEGDLKKYVSKAIGVNAYKYKVVVIYDGPLAMIQSRVPPNIGLLEAVNDQRCKLEIGVECLDNVPFYLCMAGANFEIIEPAALKEHCRLWMKRLEKAAE